MIRYNKQHSTLLYDTLHTPSKESTPGADRSRVFFVHGASLYRRGYVECHIPCMYMESASYPNTNPQTQNIAPGGQRSTKKLRQRCESAAAHVEQSLSAGVRPDSAQCAESARGPDNTWCRASSVCSVPCDHVCRKLQQYIGVLYLTLGALSDSRFTSHSRRAASAGTLL